jgi:hypothetical protein
MPPASPLPPPAEPSGGRATLVGGLPWSPTETPDGGPRQPGKRGRRRTWHGWLIGLPVVGEIVEAVPWSAWRAALDRAVRASPPFTMSLSLHVVALLVLALWFVRTEPKRRPRLDLAFATPVEAKPGDGPVEVKITPVEQPEPEEVRVEQPVVPAPAAAPAEAVTPDPTPMAAADIRPPVVGALLDGRDEGRREALVAEYGGSGETEAAVARALEWIVRQQQKRDGLWSLQGPYVDGGSQENRLAATSMALLALQGAGNTPTQGRHREAVERGWRGLLAAQLEDGRFDVVPLPAHHGLYAHAQATIALCELYGMTKDQSLAEPARRAVAYAVAAQGPNGGWRYEPGKAGDMSVTGWFLMALKSAEMAGLEVPAETWARFAAFVDSVAVSGGTQYGYRFETPLRPPGPVTAAVTAEGLLCRQYLGWPRDDPRLVAGIERLVAANTMAWPRRDARPAVAIDGEPDALTEKDVYAWYYITQVVHHAGGEPWDRWNATLREVLPAGQLDRGPQAGSWDPGLDKWGHIGGRLFTTCFCTWMLEVYYRHLPLYREAVR